MCEWTESQESVEIKKQWADSPPLLAYWEGHFAGDVQVAARGALFDAVDDSTFSLRQWVESLFTLDAWLQARGLAMSIEDQLGYICCAGEAAGAGANMTHLPDLVSEMLEAYGCERAVKCTARTDGEGRMVDDEK